MDIFERNPFKVRMNEMITDYKECLAKRANIEAVGVFHIRGLLISFLTGNILAIFILAIEKFRETNLKKILKKALNTLLNIMICIIYNLKRIIEKICRKISFIKSHEN